MYLKGSPEKIQVPSKAVSCQVFKHTFSSFLGTDRYSSICNVLVDKSN